MLSAASLAHQRGQRVGAVTSTATVRARAQNASTSRGQCGGTVRSVTQKRANLTCITLPSRFRLHTLLSSSADRARTLESRTAPHLSESCQAPRVCSADGAHVSSRLGGKLDRPPPRRRSEVILFDREPDQRVMHFMGETENRIWCSTASSVVGAALSITWAPATQLFVHLAWW